MVKENISASYYKTIFFNKDSRFTVALYMLKNSESNTYTTLTGSDLPLEKGVTYDFEGNWEKDEKYGKRFAVSDFRQRQAKGREAIIEYFSSSLYKGIGRKTAELIYDSFGENIFNIIENDPIKILYINGMTRKKYEQFITSYRNNKLVTKLYQKLKNVDNISVGICKKIYNKFGEESLSIVEEHPYYLSYIKDIGFLTSERIAHRNYFKEDSFERFCAGAEHVLMTTERDGNTGMDIQCFGNEVYELLRKGCPLVTKELINDFTIKAIKEGKFIYKTVKTNDISKNYIFRKKTYKCEKESAENIIRLYDNLRKYDENKILSIIKEIEDETGIKLDEDQIKAVIMIINNGFSVVTGGAGTGKTTTTNTAIGVYESLCKGKVELLAPTGRAARRMAEITGKDARTIHSRIHLITDDSGYDVKIDDEDVTISHSLVIVDESSMLDVHVCNHLLSSIEDDCNVVFIGDPGQLPSVGAGSILRDIIASGSIPVTNLTKTYRQKEGSGIIENSKKINEGNINIEATSDFRIYDINNSRDLETRMVELYLKDVHEYGIMEVACLCPVRAYEAGVNSMNTRIQNILNPEKKGKAQIKLGTRVLRKGDIVMELENHQTVMNGDVGIIDSIITERENETIYVKYEGGTSRQHIEEYKSKDFGRLALAYAMTIHKAQGSEYKSVITCLQNVNKRMAKRNVIYTAVTRGKEIVRFCGSKTALMNAIQNNDVYMRKTMLSNMLAYALGNEIRM